MTHGHVNCRLLFQVSVVCSSWKPWCDFCSIIFSRRKRAFHWNVGSVINVSSKLGTRNKMLWSIGHWKKPCCMFLIPGNSRLAACFSSFQNISSEGFLWESTTVRAKLPNHTNIWRPNTVPFIWNTPNHNRKFIAAHLRVVTCPPGNHSVPGDFSVLTCPSSCPDVLGRPCHLETKHKINHHRFSSREWWFCSIAQTLLFFFWKWHFARSQTKLGLGYLR